MWYSHPTIVQKYLTDIKRLNVYANISDHHLINIILNRITPCLWQVMGHYEDLLSDPSSWKEKLLHVDFITSEFQKKEQDNRTKGQWKEGCLEDRVKLRGGEVRSEKMKSEYIPKDVWDQGKKEGRCMKCGSSNH